MYLFEKLPDERFLLNILFPLIKTYKNLVIFINEVKDNDILSDRYKRKLYLKVEQQLLQHYFYVCNKENSRGQKECDLTIFNLDNFNSDSFYELNNIFIKNGLFQIHDLDYYKKNS